MKLNNSINRNLEGSYKLIPPSEYEAWCRLTGTLVYPSEYDILCAMDRMYCEEANKELEDYRSRKYEEQQREVEQARKRRK